MNKNDSATYVTESERVMLDLNSKDINATGYYPWVAWKRVGKNYSLDIALQDLYNREAVGEVNTQDTGYFYWWYRDSKACNYLSALTCCIYNSRFFNNGQYKMVGK